MSSVDREGRADSDPTRVTVLVIDDTPVGRRVMTHVVRLAGCIPIGASTLDAAERIIAAGGVDAIVTDLFLRDERAPSRDTRGSETVRRLRDVAGMQIPMLAVTSYPASPEIDWVEMQRLDCQLISSDAIVDLERWLDALIRLPPRARPLITDSTLRRVARIGSVVGAALAAIGAVLVAAVQHDWSLLRMLLGGAP